MTKADKIDHDNYINYQFKQLDPVKEWPAKLKIVSGGSETNWINLNQKQVEKIRKILKTA